MITMENIAQYQGANISSGKNYLYILPNALLRPYISHYCVSFPTPQTMSDEYSVLPSASSVMCISVDGGEINTSYNGTNTKASVVGDYANKKELLLLIKFQSGGFFPFYGFHQDELADQTLDLSCIDKTLAAEINNGLEKSRRMEDLIITLDAIFLNHLKVNNDYVTAVMNKIITRNGNITVREISTDYHYSEKHIRRLFLQHIGVSVKKFSRIVRLNYALQLLQNKNMLFTDIAEQSAFFDQPHFIHDFKSLCGLTPQEYTQNMSVFYNYNFTL